MCVLIQCHFHISIWNSIFASFHFVSILFQAPFEGFTIIYGAIYLLRVVSVKLSVVASLYFTINLFPPLPIFVSFPRRKNKRVSFLVIQDNNMQLKVMTSRFSIRFTCLYSNNLFQAHKPKNMKISFGCVTFSLRFAGCHRALRGVALLDFLLINSTRLDTCLYDFHFSIYISIRLSYSNFTPHERVSTCYSSTQLSARA